MNGILILNELFITNIDSTTLSSLLGHIGHKIDEPWPGYLGTTHLKPVLWPPCLRCSGLSLNSEIFSSSHHHGNCCGIH